MANADWFQFFGKRQVWKDLQLLAGTGLNRNVQGTTVHPKTSPGQGWE